jgi:hypothetical protein
MSIAQTVEILRVIIFQKEGFISRQKKEKKERLIAMIHLIKMKMEMRFSLL